MTSAPDPNLIAYGDFFTADSEATMTSLGGNDKTLEYHMSLLILSRDGSRRIKRVERLVFPNPLIFPNYALLPPSLTNPHADWPSLRYLAVNLSVEAGQTKVMWNAGNHRRGAPKMRGMVDYYVPYPPGRDDSDLSSVPVNQIPRCIEMREALATAAHGWDITWHSRYVYQDHLRQQVTERMIDGLLVYANEKIDELLRVHDASLISSWKTALPIVEQLVKEICDLCTGDPAIWARRMARNLDVLQFSGRLQIGDVPKIITATMPWTPGITLSQATVPADVTNVNLRREIIARWHDSNRSTVESGLLRYYDEDMQRLEERDYGYNTSHEHQL